MVAEDFLQDPQVRGWLDRRQGSFRTRPPFSNGAQPFAASRELWSRTNLKSEKSE